MPKSVIIIGGAGGSKVAFEIFTACGLRVKGLMDNYIGCSDCRNSLSIPMGSYREAKNVKLLKSHATVYFVATGDNSIRENHVQAILELTKKGPISAVHPSSEIASSAAVWGGTMLGAFSVVNPYSIVEEGCIINTAAIVEHDCTVESYAQLGPRAVLCGYVTVGRRAFIGAGAVVLPHLTIGQDAVVAAGAVVTQNVEAGSMVAGVPAVIKKAVISKIRKNFMDNIESIDRLNRRLEIGR